MTHDILATAHTATTPDPVANNTTSTATIQYERNLGDRQGHLGMAHDVVTEDAITRFLRSRQNANLSTMTNRHNWTDSKAELCQ